MELHKEHVIGIAGGMGPESGVALLQSIIRHTKAGCDQEHLPAILMSFPGNIGDRTKYLEGEIQINPAYNIARIIHNLEIAGASIAGIACNTAYAAPIYQVILPELERLGCNIKLLNMPWETCQYIKLRYPGCRRIGLMTTDGTYKSGVYKSLLQDLNVEVISPDAGFQHSVIHAMVYDPRFGLKARPGILTDEVRTLMEQCIRFYIKQGADAVILGCTEFSLASDILKENELQFIDSTEAFALALIREATEGIGQQVASLLHPDLSGIN